MTDPRVEASDIRREAPVNPFADPDCKLCGGHGMDERSGGNGIDLCDCVCVVRPRRS